MTWNESHKGVLFSLVLVVIVSGWINQHDAIAADLDISSPAALRDIQVYTAGTGETFSWNLLSTSSPNYYVLYDWSTVEPLASDDVLHNNNSVSMEVQTNLDDEIDDYRYYQVYGYDSRTGDYWGDVMVYQCTDSDTSSTPDC